MAIKHSITLSTTEPNNEVGVIKIRQADEQTQMLEVQITENGVPKSYTGLAVYFCAKLGQTAGLGIIEQKLNPEEMTNPANGKLEYTMRAEDWQILGRQKGYFSFRKMKDEHEFVEQFTTRDFTFDVIKSVYSDGLKEVKKDGSTYVWTIEEMIRLFKEYISTGKIDWKNYKDDEKAAWEKFVEDNREFLETADPGGKIILELLGARGGATTLGERLNDSDAQLAQTDLKTLGIPLAPMSNVKVEESYTGVLPISFHDGWLYGFQNNTTIVRSNNDGKTWSTVATSPSGSLHSMYWTDDGEVLLVFNELVRKSIGWSVNPQTATFKTVVTRSKGLGILPWGFDGDGTKFIATEYSASDRSESRYVWISTDMGNTFNVVVDKFTIDPTNTSHMHGVCYDKWADRFFLSHGHGIIEGVHWSDDDGATWNLVEADFELDASPTTLTATINGIVGGSDSGRAGLYGIQRTENPHDMVMRRTARWDVSREGVTGFAYRSVRDEKTGQVYVAFKSDFNDISPIIMAGTATTGALLWQDTVGNSSSFQFLTVTDKKVIGVHGAQGAYKLIVGNKPSNGVDTFDSGNILTGKATSTSIAIGQNVDVKTANEIVIGNNATLNPTSSNTRNVVIGTNAQGTARDVVIGNNVKSNIGGEDGVVIGNGANSSSAGGIALGLGATVPASSNYGVAIGHNTTASINGIAIGRSAKIITSTNHSIAIGTNALSGNDSVAIGRDANAGTSQVAIGHNASSGHGNSLALGANSVTTGENQLAIGKRHIEFEVSTTPGIPPIGNARVYLKDNATTGKQELCVRFRNAEVVIATQP